MIYVTTGGVTNQPAWKTSEDFLEKGIRGIELSGGLFCPDTLSRLKKLKSKASFHVHNYFPPPEIPFVFNLASLSPETSRQSIEHALTAIQCAVELDNPIYSFHSGFLFDPQVNELGKRIGKRSLYDRKKVMSHFLKNVNYLAEEAKKEGVSLLIENNVLSYNNFKEFGVDPFLMTTSEECVYVMENTHDTVNMLVDVAHLKVSSNSLGYNPTDMFHLCDPWIKAYHFSDNNGLSDSNEMFDEDAWFWPFMKNDLDYYSIEVYNINPERLQKLTLLVSKKLDCNNKGYY